MLLFWVFLIPFFTSISYSTGFIVYTFIIFIGLGAIAAPPAGAGNARRRAGLAGFAIERSGPDTGRDAILAACYRALWRCPARGLRSTTR